MGQHPLESAPGHHSRFKPPHTLEPTTHALAYFKIVNAPDIGEHLALTRKGSAETPCYYMSVS